MRYATYVDSRAQDWRRLLVRITLMTYKFPSFLKMTFGQVGSKSRSRCHLRQCYHMNCQTPRTSYFSIFKKTNLTLCIIPAEWMYFRPRNIWYTKNWT
jgi:hypothetical protein